MGKKYFFLMFVFCFFGSMLFSPVFSQVNVSSEDVIRSKHNLSSTWPADADSTRRAAKPSTTEDQVCVFCHTPHGAQGQGPLWNRNFSAELNYKPYQPQINIMTGSTKTGSLDFTKPNSPDKIQPSGYSKLCLSCHDGTIAFGMIRNVPGAGNYDPTAKTAFERIKDLFNVTAGSVGPVGKGEFTGDTRNLGINLSNDHPISFVFNNKVKIDDQELAVPDPQGSWVQELNNDRVRLYPLNFESREESVDVDLGAVQCTSCHNPHAKREKFLREPRYDEKKDNEFPGQTNQICFTCHPKPGWVYSTHELNNNSGGTPLTFRTGTDAIEADGKTLGEHGCLNCHDPHTVQGADRLHRNGASFQDGNGTPSIENTCYQCHISDIEKIPVIGGTKFVSQSPDIKSHFDKRTGQNGRDGSVGSAMPLDMNWPSYTSGSTNGIHQPVFVSETTPGKEPVLFSPANSSQVHVECVDCHNPHQVMSTNRVRGMKGITINGEIIGGDRGTDLPVIKKHNYQDDRGPKGVKGKDDTNDEYKQKQSTYDPLIYEVCLRCHGDTFDKVMPYRAKNDSVVSSKEQKHRGHMTDSPFTGEPGRKTFLNQSIPMPSLGQFGASNKRKEFDPSTPSVSRQRDTTEIPKAYVQYNSSYHPVAAPGRNITQALFNQLKDAFGLGQREELKTLTIMCTDCHNNDAFKGSAAVYDNKKKGPITGLSNGNSYRRSTDRSSGLQSAVENNPAMAQGPHGSANKRILRDRYDTYLQPDIRDVPPTIGLIKQRFALCFICHDPNVLLGEPGSTTDNTNFGNNLDKANNASLDAAGFANPNPLMAGTTETWAGNLHRYHLRLTGAYCHECHNNVHSNVEADNTVYGDGNGGELHPDQDDSDPGDGAADGYANSHLINFGPQASGGGNVSYPNWFYSGGKFQCQLRCHGKDMDQCFYTHSGSEGNNPSGGWCAGSQ